MFEFNLFEIYWVNEKRISLVNIDLIEYEGSLLSFGRNYRGSFTFDFLFFKLWSRAYLDWNDRRKGLR